jgi:chaperonin cofactor prefoldin
VPATLRDSVSELFDRIDELTNQLNGDIIEFERLQARINELESEIQSMHEDAAGEDI